MENKENTLGTNLVSWNISTGVFFGKSFIQDEISPPHELHFILTLCFAFALIVFESSIFLRLYISLRKLRMKIQINLLLPKNGSQFGVYVILYVITFFRSMNMKNYNQSITAMISNYTVFLVLQTLLLLSLRKFIYENYECIRMVTATKMVFGAMTLFLLSVCYPFLIIYLLLPSKALFSLDNDIYCNILYTSILYSITCGVLIILISKISTKLSRIEENHELFAIELSNESVLARLRKESLLVKQSITVAVLYTVAYLFLSVLTVIGDFGAVDFLGDFSNLITAYTLFSMNSLDQSD